MLFEVVFGQQTRQDPRCYEDHRECLPKTIQVGHPAEELEAHQHRFSRRPRLSRKLMPQHERREARRYQTYNGEIREISLGRSAAMKGVQHEHDQPEGGCNEKGQHARKVISTKAYFDGIGHRSAIPIWISES